MKDLLREIFLKQMLEEEEKEAKRLALVEAKRLKKEARRNRPLGRREGQSAEEYIGSFAYSGGTSANVKSGGH